METTGKDRPGPMQEFLTLQKMASLRICTGRGIREPTYSLTASPAGSYLGCLLPLLTDLHGVRKTTRLVVHLWHHLLS